MRNGNYRPLFPPGIVKLEEQIGKMSYDDALSEFGPPHRDSQHADALVLKWSDEIRVYYRKANGFLHHSERIWITKLEFDPGTKLLCMTNCGFLGGLA